MKKVLIIVSVLITIMLFATGCGSKIDSQPPADQKEEQTEEAPSETGDKKDTETTEEKQEEKTEESSALASKDDMVEVEEVVEDWMVPIYASSLNDGTYPITVASSSSMFKIEKAELTVSDGEMTAVMTMGGKGYRYLYMGTGEEAINADESEYIPYVEDSEGAHTYTVPVEALDQGVDCTAFSNKKEKWYDRSLAFRSDSLPLNAFKDELVITPDKLALDNGEYTVDVLLNGGTGRTTVDSPTKIVFDGETCLATIAFSSPHYDYMIVDGEKYLPINTEGNSTFEIPVSVFDRPMQIIADTVAMSEPHEITYVLIFDSSSIK